MEAQLEVKCVCLRLSPSLKTLDTAASPLFAGYARYQRPYCWSWLQGSPGRLLHRHIFMSVRFLCERDSAAVNRSLQAFHEVSPVMVSFARLCKAGLGEHIRCTYKRCGQASTRMSFRLFSTMHSLAFNGKRAGQRITEGPSVAARSANNTTCILNPEAST